MKTNVKNNTVNILIIDNDDYCLSLINNFIKPENYIATSLEIAHTINDALELIKYKQINLIITNTHIDGEPCFCALKKIRERQPNIIFILIGDVMDFQIVKKAIHYNVSDYLLKPISPIDFKKSLTRAYSTMHLTISNNTLTLQSNFLEKIIAKIALKNDISSHLIPLESVITSNFTDGLFQILIFKLDISNLDTERIVYAINTLIEKELISKLTWLCHKIDSYTDNTSLYILINYSSEYEEIIQKIIVNASMHIINKKYFHDLDLTLGLGIVVNRIEELGLSLCSAQRIIEDRILQGSNKILYGIGEISRKDLSNMIAHEFCGSVSIAFHTSDVSVFTKSINKIKLNILCNSKYSGSEILQALRLVLNIYIVEMIQIGKPIYNSSDFFYSISDALNNLNTLDNIITFLNEEICNSFLLEIQNKEEDTNETIHMAKYYIDNNYAKNVTLKEVAAYVGYNPNYFSTFFKQHSQESFNEYLTYRRIEAAKTLLISTNDTVDGIARSVGYNDPKYFYELFKKHTHITPSEYRKTYHKPSI